MDSKDNRFKDKRAKMKQHYVNHPRKNQQRGASFAGANHTSSSSPQVDGGVHSIVDVADSSDEPRFARGKGWTGRSGAAGRQSQRMPPLQMNRERLDLTHNERADLYENDEALNNKENAQLCAGNFQQMAEQLTLGGGHFSFDEEKQWTASLQKGEAEQKIIDANEYFTLNFKMLKAGLQTIPFYKRMDYAASMFTRDQLNAMNEAAEKAEKSYQQNYGKKPSIQVKSASQRSGNEEKDELDELLDMTTDQVTKVSLSGGATPISVAPSTPATVPATAATVASDTKDDVQNWLDSVLEE